ncbi:hypothetical protein WOLCODRAFT_101165, partial [Wolfiporia cocos MD-104 SS10]
MLQIANRYTVLFSSVANILPAITWTNALSCESWLILIEILDSISFLIVASFSAARVYAIGNHQWLLAAITFILGSMLFATNLFTDYRQSYSYITYFGGIATCNRSDHVSVPTLLLLSILASISAIVSDIIVIAVTWVHTFVRNKGYERARLKV